MCEQFFVDPLIYTSQFLLSAKPVDIFFFSLDHFLFPQNFCLPWGPPLSFTFSKPQWMVVWFIRSQRCLNYSPTPIGSSPVCMRLSEPGPLSRPHRMFHFQCTLSQLFPESVPDLALAISDFNLPIFKWIKICSILCLLVLL